MTYRIIKIFLLMITALSCLSVPVYAQTQQIEAEIPVISSEQKTVRIIPDAKSPDPEQETVRLKKGKNRIAVKFSEPGNYRYTISDGKKTSYDVKISVTSDDSGELDAEMTATKDGKYKDDISFGSVGSDEDSDNSDHRSPQPEKTDGNGSENGHSSISGLVKTGDSTQIAVYVAGMSLSLLAMIIIGHHIMQKKQKGQEV